MLVDGGLVGVEIGRVEVLVKESGGQVGFGLGEVDGAGGGGELFFGGELEPVVEGFGDGGGGGELVPVGIDGGVAGLEGAEGEFASFVVEREAEGAGGGGVQGEAWHIVEVGGAGFGDAEEVGLEGGIDEVDGGGEAGALGLVPEADSE
ncbi:MAG: hypothetical protein RI897_2809 [Verrucomicrobiota bacterium]